MKTRQLLLTIALVSSIVGCGSAPPEDVPREAKPTVTVDVEVLGAGSVEQTVPLTGVVRARQRAAITAQVTATVRAVEVEEGQAVHSGRSLVSLDDRQLRSAVDAARGMKAEAEAAIAAGQQGISAAEAQLDLASATHERYRLLLEKESASQHEYDAAEAGLKAAQAALARARAQAAQAEAKRAQAEAQIASSETTLGYAHIAAPFAGVVTARHVDPGDLAHPGTPLIEIEQAGEYRLEAAVPESLIGSVRVGQQVTVDIDVLGDNGPTHGRIAVIEPAGDASSRTFLAKVSVASSPGLRSGLYGRVFLPGDARDTVGLPASAVVERGQIRSVFVVEEGTARRRLVTLGEPANGRYEVLSGLETGDRVVLNPRAVMDGSPVEERR